MSEYNQYFRQRKGDVFIRTDFKKVMKNIYGKDLKAIIKNAFMLRLNNNRKAPIPADVRWLVWERDNFTCQKCGSRKNLSIDHIIPESKGGEATMENCQTLCKTCNSSKGAR